MNIHKVNIEVLIKGVQEKNERCQMELYKRFAKAMFIVAISIVKDEYLGEDVIQESFMNAFKNINKCNDSKAFPGWIKKIVIRKAISKLKEEEKYLFRKETLEDFVTEESKEKLHISVENKMNVKKALEKIPNQYMIIIQLYYLEGYDYDEICEILNIKYANARVLLSRAIKRLKLEVTNG